MVHEQVEIIKRELDQYLERTKEMQNPPNNLVQGLNHELELSQNFFLDDNVNCSQQQHNNILFLKRQYIDVPCAGKEDIAQRKLNQEIS